MSRSTRKPAADAMTYESRWTSNIAPDVFEPVADEPAPPADPKVTPQP